jgi:arsenate reductase (glutaredoxin)
VSPAASDAPVTVWHNPRCSKSRGACGLLDEHGTAIAVRRYLDDPPTRAELDELLTMLDVDDVREVVRTDEKVYRELGLAEASDEDLLDAIVAHPILLQRPIVVVGERAVIARPPERLFDLLG